MKNSEESVDINEAFDNLLFAEEIAQNAGYAIGYETGRVESISGYHLGYHKASLVASQLGYYSGILEQYLNKPANIPSRAHAVAVDLLREISEFPEHNDEELDIMKHLDFIKSKYAKFCALAKINAPYPETDKLEF